MGLPALLDAPVADELVAALSGAQGALGDLMTIAVALGRPLSPGDWRIVAAVGRTARGPLYELACVRCDRRRRAAARTFPTLGPCACDTTTPERDPTVEGPLVDHWTPWEDDDRCWYVVHCHPGGLSLREVGDLMDISYEAVRLLEQNALAKLLETHPEELRQMLAELDDRGCDEFPGDAGEAA